MSDNNPFATANYLVPLDGTTHTVVSSFAASATPYKIDWREFSNNNFSFWPQGAYVDNSGGTSTLTITIEPIGYTVDIPAGAKRVVGWPAPKNQTASIIGNGAAKIYFVNFPVFNSAPEVSGSQSVTVDGQPISVGISGQPISNNPQTFDGTNWNPTEPPAPGVNSILTGLTTAAGAAQDLVLDLGAQYRNYKEASFVFEGNASTTNALRAYGSNDNVTFAFLSRIDAASIALVTTTGADLAVGCFIMGYRYLKATYVNGTTAQTNAVLLIGAQ